MKLKSILLCGAAALALASCSGNGGEKKADLQNASAADSLLYYFGQRQAADYWRVAESDTLYLSEDARRDYVRGMQAGMSAIRQGDDAYNQGLYQGMQMALNIAEFEKEYNLKLNPKVLIESIKEGLANDSAVDAATAQKEFYAIMGELNRQREENNRQEAAKNLAEAQKKLNMQKITDDLYGSVVSKGDTVKLKDGDKIKVDIKATDEGGKELAIPFPPEITIGDRFMGPVMTIAYETMTNGETKKFATTGYALFQGRSSRMGIEPDAVILLTVHAILDNGSAKAPEVKGDAKNDAKQPREIKERKSNANPAVMKR